MNESKYLKKHGKYMFIIPILSFLLISPSYGQRMTTKNYPVLKEYYGIRVYHMKKPSSHGNFEQDFFNYTGRDFKPPVFYEGYGLFNENHYLALIDKIYPFVRDNTVKKMLENETLRNQIASDIHQYTRQGIEPGESKITCMIRTDPGKKLGPVYFSIFPIAENDTIRLRIYENGVAGTIAEYLFSERPVKTGHMNEKEEAEFNKIIEEAFWRYYSYFTKAVFEIGPDDEVAFKPEWE